MDDKLQKTEIISPIKYIMNYYILVAIVLIIVLAYMIGTRSTKTVVKEHMETQDQMTAHKSKALVLNCMDFRLIDDLERFLDSAGYNNNYDDFVLAGASLGYNQKVYPAWKDVFNTHVELAEQLHEIHEILIIDHMNCGAYKKFYGKTTIPPDEERALHRKNLNKMERVLKKKFPNLKVKKYLMNLDGTVEEINNPE